MDAYRYRTRALVGPWRLTRREAEQDAVCARQAEICPAGNFSWRVPGLIEPCDRGDAAADGPAPRA